jgi:hypothetical protein
MSYLIIFGIIAMTGLGIGLLYALIKNIMELYKFSPKQVILVLLAGLIVWFIPADLFIKGCISVLIISTGMACIGFSKNRER